METQAMAKAMLVVLLLILSTRSSSTARFGPGPKKGAISPATSHADERFLAFRNRLNAEEAQSSRVAKGGPCKYDCEKKKIPKKKKEPKSKPKKATNGMEPVVPTINELKQMGRSHEEYVRTWVPPFTVREKYQDNQYTLSGGIYESAALGTCEDIAKMMGMCPWPCQTNGANDGSAKWRPKWVGITEKINPKYDGSDEKMPCLVQRAHPPWPEPYKSKEGTGSREKGGDTSDTGPFGQKYEPTECICVDPCSLYKTCGECTLIKRTYNTLPQTVGVSPWNCAWCEGSCVSADAIGPKLFQECAGRYSYTYAQCGPTITPEDIFLPGPHEVPAPEDGGPEQAKTKEDQERIDQPDPETPEERFRFSSGRGERKKVLDDVEAEMGVDA